MRRLLAAAGLAAAILVGGLTPAATAIAPVRAGTAGFCPGATGVTVVVDYQALGGATEIRCAPGAQASGLAALQNAGFTVTGTQRWGLALVCRINGKPGPDTEPCVNTPPANAFWAYWHASNGGTWTFSDEGASTFVPAQGSFEGWSFSTGTGGTGTPPRVTPVRPTRG